jgi:dienelactone hydrolase
MPAGINPARVILVLLALVFPAAAFAQQFPPNWRLADTNLTAYFEAEVSRLESACLADVKTLDDWTRQRDERRRQLFDMLGLWPLPERTELKPVITGKVDGDDFFVEKLHFQSLPGLYVTANLYLPRNLTAPAPAILYVCGHAEVKTNGISYGNKTGYQHHGAWFARHGYVCLTIDTLQLGEIQGNHHGTHRLGQWWWNSRGYTPAGVEAWNSIRALDYLETRSEVDRTRLGMTGRSGGGSYTWTTAALDERVKVAAPVAGITDLRNHVCDGAVEGHCDCMFFVNTHRWDFPLVAALIAPRPLLIVNTDADSIFPLDGVNRLFAKTRRLYELHGTYDKLGLVIGPGPHSDSQNLQLPVLRWFNQHLKGTDPRITDAAEKLFSPVQLRVFEQPPVDQRNTTAQEFFGAQKTEPIATLEGLRRRLRERTFAGWPTETAFPSRRESGTNFSQFIIRRLDFLSQSHVPLHLTTFQHKGQPIRRVDLLLQDDAGWSNWTTFARVLPPPPTNNAFVEFSPRGIGPAAWPGDARKQIQLRRRFQLLGQTADGMRVWDIRRALAAVRELYPSATEVTVSASDTMAAHALHAAAFEDQPLRLELTRLPASYRDGVDYLNVAQVTDLAQVLKLVRTRHEVITAPQP